MGAGYTECGYNVNVDLNVNWNCSGLGSSSGSDSIVGTMFRFGYGCGLYIVWV